MAATRLRRTFHYPTDDEDEDAVEEGMDEQDQETLIATLSDRDNTSTKYYTYFLLILPLAPVLLYIPQLFSTSAFIPSVVAIFSLLASAYTLYFLPLPPMRPTIITTSDLRSSASSTSAKGKSILRDAHGHKSSSPPSDRRPVPYISDETADLLAKYIIPANGVLCVILALVELWRRRTWSEGMMIGGGYVPGFIMTVVMWARRELRVVDLGELERLRYRTKAT